MLQFTDVSLLHESHTYIFVFFTVLKFPWIESNCHTSLLWENVLTSWKLGVRIRYKQVAILYWFICHAHFVVSKPYSYWMFNHQQQKLSNSYLIYVSKFCNLKTNNNVKICELISCDYLLEKKKIFSILCITLESWRLCAKCGVCLFTVLFFYQRKFIHDFYVFWFV